MQNDRLMTDRPKPIFFLVKIGSQSFCMANISRQDDVGNYSFFEYWQYFLFSSFSWYGVGYMGHSIDIPVAEMQRSNKYIIKNNTMPRMTGLNWDPYAAKPYSVLSRTALELGATWHKWEWMSGAFHCKILCLSHTHSCTAIVKPLGMETCLFGWTTRSVSSVFTFMENVLVQKYP